MFVLALDQSSISLFLEMMMMTMMTVEGDDCIDNDDVIEITFHCIMRQHKFSRRRQTLSFWGWQSKNHQICISQQTVA